MKKQPKFINVGVNPIMIVGEKMGKQRPGQDQFALEGNGTGDFVHEAIEGKSNIILTNIVNYYYEGDFNPFNKVEEGLEDLENIIKAYKPIKIICLGNIAYKYIRKVSSAKDVPVIKLRHPSWVNRFKRSLRANYIKHLRYELN